MKGDKTSHVRHRMLFLGPVETECTASGGRHTVLADSADSPNMNVNVPPNGPRGRTSCSEANLNAYVVVLRVSPQADNNAAYLECTRPSKIINYPNQ